MFLFEYTLPHNVTESGYNKKSKYLIMFSWYFKGKIRS